MSFIKRTLSLGGKSKKKKGSKKSKKTANAIEEGFEDSIDGEPGEGTEEFNLALKQRQRETVDNWSHQFGSIWSLLDIVEERISSSLAIVKIRTSIQLAEQQGLVLEYKDWESRVDGITVLGEQLSNSEILEGEQQESVGNDVTELQNRWDKIKEGYITVEARIQHLLAQHATLENWKRGWSLNMVWINSKQEELASVEELNNNFNTLEQAANQIGLMFQDISSYRANVDNIISFGNGIIKDKTIDNESMPSIRSDIRTLESTWEYLKEKCAAVQLSIKEKMVMVEEKDQLYMREWEEIAVKIDDWFASAEREMFEFDKANEDILSLEEQVGGHEELVFRLATEEKKIDEYLEQGDEYLGKVRSNDSKNKIKNDMKALTKRKSKVNTKLVGQQESLTSRLDWLLNIEKAELDTWKTHAQEVDEHLNKFEVAMADVSIDNVRQAKEQIVIQEALLKGIDDYNTEIDKLHEIGHSLITGKKLSKAKAEEIKEGNKNLRDRFRKIREQAFVRHREYQEDLLHLQQQQNDQLGSWITKAQIFEVVIDRILETLNSILDENTEQLPLVKLLNQEIELKETKIDVLNRTDKLERHVEEGANLASSEHMQEEPDKHEQIVRYLKDLKEKWNDIADKLQDSAKRLHDLISEKQRDLLSNCWEQIEKLEQVLENAEPIGDSIEDLRNDTRDISEFFSQLDDARADMRIFDEHASEMQSMTLPSDDDKIEIKENNELLQSRLPKIYECADQRNSDIRYKVVNLLTESLAALADTLTILSGKVQNIGVPDSLEGDDLVDKLLNMEDILSRINECQTTLLDLGMLLDEADAYFELENEEKKDWKWEISSQKEGIEHLQQLTREKKSSLYALMIYHFKRHLEQLEKRLVVIETQFAEENGDPTDFKAAVNDVGKMEVFVSDLEDVQQNTDELTSQINAILGEPILSEKDNRGLKDKNSDVVDHLVSVSELAEEKIKKCQQKMKPLLTEQLERLWEWLRMMENRREHDDQIGPDSMALKKQMREMQVVEKQLNEKRISPILHYDDPIARHALDASELKSMRDADQNWYNVSEWVSKRTNNLLQAQSAWELFRQKEVDLLDYLRDQEKQVKNWEPINLEEEESVTKRLNQLETLKAQMESRKGDVGNLHQVSDDLIDIIGKQTATANNIRSQVGDIHDCWNNVVKQVLEAGSKLNVAKRRLKSLEENVKEVRTWLDDAQSVLKFYTDDIPDDVAKELRPKIEEKCTEEPKKRSTLARVNSLSREMMEDVDGTSHDVIYADITNLNRDWENVTNDLQKKHQMKKRPCCWWCYRRMFLKYGYYN